MIISVRQALEKMKADLKDGHKPYKLQLVGFEIGGKPIDEYAPEFGSCLLVTVETHVSFITSPWYHPEKGKNIAMGYIPRWNS